MANALECSVTSVKSLKQVLYKKTILVSSTYREMSQDRFCTFRSTPHLRLRHRLFI